jgi:hypothetical protein
MKRGKYLISKNNVFVLVGLVILLGSIFAVYAYGTSNPVVFGHSAGELEGGGGAACSSGQVAVGSSCKDVPSCGASQVLSYDGSSFSCKGSTTPTYAWKKMCESKANVAINSGEHPINCEAVTGGKNMHYSFDNAASDGNQGKCLLDSGNYLYSGIETFCQEGGECNVEGQYCVYNFNNDGTSTTYWGGRPYCTRTGNLYAKVYTYYKTGGAIYQCVRQ